jgi:glutaminase
VGGGILAVVPGKGAIAVFAPPLDEAGNSVKAQKVISYVADKLDLNLFAPAARRRVTKPRAMRSTIRIFT